LLLPPAFLDFTPSNVVILQSQLLVVSG